MNEGRPGGRSPFWPACRSALHLLADLREFAAIITDTAPDTEEVAASDQAVISLTIAMEDA